MLKGTPDILPLQTWSLRCWRQGKWIFFTTHPTQLTFNLPWLVSVDCRFLCVETLKCYAQAFCAISSWINVCFLWVLLIRSPLYLRNKRDRFSKTIDGTARENKIKLRVTSLLSFVENSSLPLFSTSKRWLVHCMLKKRHFNSFAYFCRLSERTQVILCLLSELVWLWPKPWRQLTS